MIIKRLRILKKVGYRMTIKEIIDKLSGYNLEAEINIVVDGYVKPYTICFGGAEGVTKANCEAVDLIVDDISEVEE